MKAESMTKGELVDELIKVSTVLGAARIAININYSKAEIDQERLAELRAEVLSRMSK